MLTLFQFIGTVIVAWFVSLRYGEFARKSARVVSLFAGLTLCWLAISGLVFAPDKTSSIHRWSGHAWIILVWCCVPYAVGVLLQQYARSRPALALGQLLLFLLLLGAGLLESFTGYLGPSYAPSINEEAINRFKILHFLVLPSVIGLLVVEWWWFFRPSGPDQLSITAIQDLPDPASNRKPAKRC